VSEADWQYALRKAGGPANPQGLWPVAVSGFAQLQAHKAAQDAAIAENRAYLSQLRTATQRVCAAQDMELRQRTHAILRQHVQLAHRLLKVRESLSFEESFIDTLPVFDKKDVTERLQASEMSVRNVSCETV
jgi:hypothetical protein